MACADVSDDPGLGLQSPERAASDEAPLGLADEDVASPRQSDEAVPEDLATDGSNGDIGEKARDSEDDDNTRLAVAADESKPAEAVAEAEGEPAPAPEAEPEADDTSSREVHADESDPDNVENEEEDDEDVEVLVVDENGHIVTEDGDGADRQETKTTVGQGGNIEGGQDASVQEDPGLDAAIARAEQDEEEAGAQAEAAENAQMLEVEEEEDRVLGTFSTALSSISSYVKEVNEKVSGRTVHGAVEMYNDVMRGRGLR